MMMTVALLTLFRTPTTGNLLPAAHPRAVEREGPCTLAAASFQQHDTLDFPLHICVQPYASHIKQGQ